MKALRCIVVAAVGLVTSVASAFHGGGVASCESCHTMHNAKTSSTGTTPAKMGTNSNAVYTAPKFLLQGSDPSSTCLNCHGPTTPGSYHVFDANALTTVGQINANTLNYTPGGDFAWLQLGNRKGHNIEALDYPGFSAKPETRKAPPGLQNSTWDGTGFSCVSCHDPHGQSRYNSAGTETRSQVGAAIADSGSYGAALEPAGFAIGVYRILGSMGWQPHSAPTQPAITVGAPVAIAPKTYNASETAFAITATNLTGQTAVKYVSGMSDWCSTCHGAMHGQASTGLTGAIKHPSGASATLGALATTYNSYLQTGNLSGVNAYDAMIPFEVGGTRADAVTAGGWADVTQAANIAATASANVSCLTCHRAHASGFDSLLRWETTGDGFVCGTSGEFAGRDGAAKYNRVVACYLRGALTSTSVYGADQRNLCNKCHAKD